MEYRCEIGGRNVILRYTVNSMCAVEDAAGGALDEVFDRQFTAARLLLSLKRRHRPFPVTSSRASSTGPPGTG